MKEKMTKWMGKTNMFFTSVTGERVTNGEVLFAHIGLVVFILAIGIAGNFD